jgi:GTPase
MNITESFHSGFIAIFGRPNVGKSTLMNTLIGEKISIVSAKPQTTRNRILGVLGRPDFQIVFVDTPGIHKPRTKLGSYMAQTIQDAMEGIDGLITLIDVSSITQQDHSVVADMSLKKTRRFLVLNKIDLIQPQMLLSIIASFAKYEFDAILPVSAKTGTGIDDLLTELVKYLPKGPRYFPNDMITDQPERMICAELIREKALRNLRDEVPHGIGVEMLAMNKLNDGFMEIHANIYCERESHKGIIIGKHGAMLSLIGQEARKDIESLLGLHVNLQLWIKIRPDWRNSPADLHTLGYE